MSLTIEPRVNAPCDDLYEVTDGLIVEKAPMGSFEVFVATQLVLEIGISARASGAGTVLSEMLYDFVSQTGHKLRPDVSFVSAHRWPINKPVPLGEGWKFIPDLAVEVLSFSNTARDIGLKIKHYFEVGVEQVWIIEPVAEWIQIYSSPKSITVLNREDVLTYDRIPGFRLPLEQLFLRDE